MSIPDWVDQYFKMRHPDDGNELFVDIRPIIFEKFGVNNDPELKLEIIKRVMFRNAKKDEYLRSCDQSILDALGTNLAELQSMLNDKRMKSAGGKKRVAIKPDRTKVLESFIESENLGRSFAQAVSAAKQVAPKITEKSIRKWLSQTIQLGLNTTRPATRAKKIPSIGTS